MRKVLLIVAADEWGLVQQEGTLIPWEAELMIELAPGEVIVKAEAKVAVLVCAAIALAKA